MNKKRVFLSIAAATVTAAIAAVFAMNRYGSTLGDVVPTTSDITPDNINLPANDDEIMEEQQTVA